MKKLGKHLIFLIIRVKVEVQMEIGVRIILYDLFFKWCKSIKVSITLRDIVKGGHINDW